MLRVTRLPYTSLSNYLSSGPIDGMLGGRMHNDEDVIR